MDIQRLKFAWARGARIQMDRCLDSVPQWQDTNSPHFGNACNWRIHPDDAHLEYGPISSALRESVLGQGNALAAEAVWIASTLFEDATLPHFYPLCHENGYELVGFLHLFLAELLADEGL